MPRTPLVAATLTCLIAVVMAAPPAASQDLPLRRSEHPLTLPAGHLAVTGALSLTDPDPVLDNLLQLDAGVAWGIVDALEVGAVVLPLRLSPNLAYLNPSLYTRARFLEAPAIEMGAEIAASLPVRGGTDAELTASLPILLDLGARTALSLAPGVRWLFRDPETAHSLVLPISFHASFTDRFFLNVRTGFDYFDLDALTIPLAFAVGYTASTPHIDVSLDVSWPSFVTLDEIERMNASIYTVAIVARAYFH